MRCKVVDNWPFFISSLPSGMCVSPAVIVNLRVTSNVTRVTKSQFKYGGKCGGKAEFAATSEGSEFSYRSRRDGIEL